MGNAATATPAVDGERVYVYFGSYGVIAYDLKGQLAWQVPMAVLQNGFGSGTSPVVTGDLVLINRQEPKDPFIVALDRKTGKEVWKHRYQIPPGLPSGYASYSTPVIAGNRGDRPWNGPARGHRSRQRGDEMVGRHPVDRHELTDRRR